MPYEITPALTERALCNGKTLAFQARDAGSIPAARSNPQTLRDFVALAARSPLG